ncbi:reverse transcriptase domain-containing protein [Tanacetum coccineum]
MPNNVKTYDGTRDPEDHLKIFQAATQVERWAMPTWCHMFNSTLIGAARVWFDELPPESIDGYKGLKAAFLTYFMQQKKYVKDPVEIHNIKQRDGETIEDFMDRFKVETGRMKGAPECMRISGFMHGVNNPKLTKHLNEQVPKIMEEMMAVTTAFIRGEADAASKKKGHLPCKSQDQPKQNASEQKYDFRCQSREGQGSSRFTPLTRTPKEILATEAGKFKPPPPMVTLVEKRSSNKFCDFHNDKGHSTDECMQLKKQIEELVRAGKLSHLIKEIKQGRDQTKNGKKETPAKDKSLAIYMIQPWQRITKQKLTQSFARVSEITFPPLASSDGTEGPLVIEAEIGGHMIHRMYIDGGSSTEVLYEHCFNQLRPEIKSQMVPATTSLTGFSGETIWPLGQLRLLVTIGDADHCTRAWMNFMIVRSMSPYNGIIGRSGIREIQAVPSTAHGMLKFPVDGGIVTIRSTILIPAECATVITSSKEIPKEAGVRHENFKVAIHPNFPDQEVAIGGTLSAKGRTGLCTLLKENLDIFAWQPSDMTGVPRSVAEHRLNIREGYSPVRQKKGARPQIVRKPSKQRSLSKSAEKSLPLFKTLKKYIKKSDFHWTSKAEQAFMQLKQHLSELPLMVAPKPKEELIIYLSASYGAGPELNYTPMEKLVLSLVFTAKRLRRATTKVERHARRTQYNVPPKDIGERTYTGGLPCRKARRKPARYTSCGNPTGAVDTVQGWIVMCRWIRCRSNPDKPGGDGVHLCSTVLEALIAGLRIAAQIGMRKVQVSVDSKLVANQVLGTFAHLSKQVLVEILREKSIQEEEVATVIEEEETTWMTPITEYLKDGTLPDEKRRQANSV